VQKEQWGVASDEWLSREIRIAWGATPGKHVKSAEAIEKKQDGFRSGAKERKRVAEEGGRRAYANGELESERRWETFLRWATQRRIARIVPFVYDKVLKSID
jgi:hypothetical protein